MRRAVALGIISIILIFIGWLCQTAVDPADFSGDWYSSFDQSVYEFREGIVYCEKHSLDLTQKDSISGAYTFCKDSVFLFAAGIPGLEQEKQLYLIRKDNGSFLCEHPDGSGTVYFIRSDS